MPSSQHGVIFIGNEYRNTHLQHSVPAQELDTWLITDRQDEPRRSLDD